ncbi:MAG TPA: hypothetical protein VNQ76_18120, partial [Planctomicrobium sp.]|nr:hypothetical protein [Planctomicrobium sp.]
RVNIEAPALESFTSGAIDTWTPLADGQPTVTAHRAKTEGYMTTGGGLQLIIPNAQSVLHLDRHP